MTIESGAGERTDAPAATHPSPRDYRELNAAFAVLLAALAGVAHRHPERVRDLSGRELALMSAATFTLAKAVAREKIGSWVREPLEAEATRSGLMQALAELVHCTRCVGTWSALGVVGLRLLAPTAGRTVSTVLATAAANDVGQAAFRLLCEAQNRASGR
jgi:hypothetical protein